MPSFLEGETASALQNILIFAKGSSGVPPSVLCQEPSLEFHDSQLEAEWDAYTSQLCVQHMTVLKSIWNLSYATHTAFATNKYPCCMTTPHVQLIVTILHWERLMHYPKCYIKFFYLKWQTLYQLLKFNSTHSNMFKWMVKTLHLHWVFLFETATILFKLFKCVLFPKLLVLNFNFCIFCTGLWLIDKCLLFESFTHCVVK